MARFRIISTAATKKRYGAGKKMASMIGRIINIQEPKRPNDDFTYAGFTWDYRDVIPVDKNGEDIIPEKPEPATFDPKNLIGV